jgi:hypothetical protein
MQKNRATIKIRAEKPTAQTAHLFFPNASANAEKTKELFLPNAQINTIRISCFLNFDKLYLTLVVK